MFGLVASVGELASTETDLLTWRRQRRRAGTPADETFNPGSALSLRGRRTLEDLHVLAQPPVLPPQSRQCSVRSSLVSPSVRLPASRSACLTQSRTAISALNSGVNARRGRRGGFGPVVSLTDILPGVTPLISGVRQNGSGPGWERLGERPDSWRNRNRIGWGTLLPHFAAAITRRER